LTPVPLFFRTFLRNRFGKKGFSLKLKKIFQIEKGGSIVALQAFFLGGKSQNLFLKKNSLSKMKKEKLSK